MLLEQEGLQQGLYIIIVVGLPRQVGTGRGRGRWSPQQQSFLAHFNRQMTFLPPNQQCQSTEEWMFIQPFRDQTSRNSFCRKINTLLHTTHIKQCKLSGFLGSRKQKKTLLPYITVASSTRISQPCAAHDIVCKKTNVAVNFCVKCSMQNSNKNLLCKF